MIVMFTVYVNCNSTPTQGSVRKQVLQSSWDLQSTPPMRTKVGQSTSSLSKKSLTSKLPLLCWCINNTSIYINHVPLSHACHEPSAVPKQNREKEWKLCCPVSKTPLNERITLDFLSTLCFTNCYQLFCSSSLAQN